MDLVAARSSWLAPPLCLLTLVTAAAGQERDLGSEVLAVFESACAECHAPGSDDPKAQRFWADARDLAGLAAGELIDVADPEFSILWEEVSEGRMPPDDHEPLDEARKAVILAWIAGGAPLPLSQPEPETEPEPVPGSVPSEPPVEEGPEPLTIVGKLHPLTVHFPIAFLLAAALAELCVLLRVRAAGARVAGRFLVTVAALGAPVAAFCGWQAGDASTTRYEDVLFRHRWLGVATVCTCALLWLASESRARARAEPPAGALAGAYRPLLLLATLLVSYGAHQGGILSRGPGYLPLPWE